MGGLLAVLLAMVVVKLWIGTVSCDWENVRGGLRVVLLWLLNC